MYKWAYIKLGGLVFGMLWVLVYGGLMQGGLIFGGGGGSLVGSLRYVFVIGPTKECPGVKQCNL